jgi:hypothetical protein
MSTERLADARACGAAPWADEVSADTAVAPMATANERTITVRNETWRFVILMRLL